MASYRLSNSAQADLRLIYLYGLQKYGEEQADRFYYGLFNCFGQISEQPQLYPLVPDIRDGYRRCVYKNLSIYYRHFGHEVEIMSILGQQDSKRQGS